MDKINEPDSKSKYSRLIQWHKLIKEVLPT